MREKKGRLSGTIVTYVGNTITNTNKTITHLALALCPELVKENRLDDAADAIWKKVDDKELNCYISGDDKVVLVTQQNIISISKKIRYWENTGYVRKDIDPQQPSHIITKFKHIDFCSHRPIEVKFEVRERDSDGNLKSSKLVSRWCAVRPQSEIFAKAVYSVGQFLDVEAEAGHALQIRNYLIQYSFLRDVRRTIQAISAAVPNNIVPMGKVMKPRYLVSEWLNEKDLDRCASKIFSLSSAYLVLGMVRLRNICYVSQAEDIFWGSTIHHTAWKNQWINKLGSIIGDIKKQHAVKPTSQI